MKERLSDTGVQTLYIEPGNPWENAHSETFNTRFEDELLDRIASATSWRRRDRIRHTGGSRATNDRTVPSVP